MKIFKQIWFWGIVIEITLLLILFNMPPHYILHHMFHSELFWVAIGSLGTVTSVAVAANSIRSSENIRKKQATYDAYSKFKEENYDTELAIEDMDIKKVIEKHKKKDNEEWDKIKNYLTKVERISTCVNLKIFDAETIYNMGGPYMIAQYDRLRTIIDYKRAKEGREVYDEFQKMILELEEFNVKRKKKMLR